MAVREEDCGIGKLLLSARQAAHGIGSCAAWRAVEQHRFADADCQPRSLPGQDLFIKNSCNRIVNRARESCIFCAPHRQTRFSQQSVLEVLLSSTPSWDPEISPVRIPLPD